MKKRGLARVSGTLLLGATLLFGGCGYKTMPIPPEDIVPVAIEDLRYKVDENGVKLTWSFPVKTIEGGVIEDISSFDLYRAEIPLEDYCGDCPVPFGKPLEIDGGATVDGEMRRVAKYESSLLKSGHKYFFKVKSRNSWLAASADSNVVTFIWFEPSAAPQNVMAKAGDREVALSWQPVTTLTSGGKLDGEVVYQVQRSAGGKEFVKVGEPVSKPMFTDTDVVNGQKYFYNVQSLMVYDDEFVSGGVSEETIVTPVDTSAPMAPTGVTAVATDVGMKIFWDRNEESDLGGYLVYRRAEGKKNYQLLGRVEPQFTLYVDQSGDDSVRYYYAISAVDQASPPNESKKSKEATARL